jgi:hypothetical protein
MINKKGQQMMGMSFGVIFAIFLIIVFIAIAFIAVGGFLDMGRSASVGAFYTEVQESVDNAMRSQSSETRFNINLPSGIKRICFANLSDDITVIGDDFEHIRDYDIFDANLFLIPPEKSENMPWRFIEKINVTKTTEKENPYCVNVEYGFKINKGFYDKLVWISR